MIKNLLFHTKKWLIIPIIGNKNALKQLYSYDFIQLSLSQPYSLVLSWAPNEASVDFNKIDRCFCFSTILKKIRHNVFVPY